MVPCSSIHGTKVSDLALHIIDVPRIPGYQGTVLTSQYRVHEKSNLKHVYVN